MARRFNLFKKRRKKAKLAEPSAAPENVDVAQKSEEIIIPVTTCADEIELTTPNEPSSEEICAEEDTKLQEEEIPPITTEESQDRILDMQKVLASSQEKGASEKKDGTEETSIFHQDDITFTSNSNDEDDSIAYLWRYIGCAPKLRSTFSVMYDDESTIQSFYTFKSINDNSIISNSESVLLKRKKQSKTQHSEQESSTGFWDRILCGGASMVKSFHYR